MRNKKVITDQEGENPLITLPLKDVEELNLRNLEDKNENLSHALDDVKKLKLKYKIV